MQPPEPLERRSARRKAPLYGLERLQRVRSGDSRSCAPRRVGGLTSLPAPSNFVGELRLEDSFEDDGTGAVKTRRAQLGGRLCSSEAGTLGRRSQPQESWRAAHTARSAAHKLPAGAPGRAWPSGSRSGRKAGETVEL